jgi:hypothetical protein
MSEIAHTPTPWKVFRVKNGVYLGIGDAEGQGIMDAGFGLWESGAVRDANAEFAVTAVNAYAAHRALIETLVKTADQFDKALAEAEAILGGEYAMHNGPLFDMAAAARTFLAAAKLEITQ